MKKAYAVIQEGGTSREHYFHTFNSLSEAEEYRKSCDKAAYATSEPFNIAAALVLMPDFFDAVEAVIDAMHEVM